MIIKPQKKDKQEIYNLWKTIFAYDDNGFINYFFTEIYDPKSFYLIKEKNTNQIISGLYQQKRKLYLNGLLFDVSVLDNLFTIYKHRNKGYADKLLETVVAELEFSELFTLIEFTRAKSFKPLGFETIYYKKRYKISRNELPKIDKYTISNVFSVNKIFSVYQQFISRFNGHLIRDLDFFNDYVRKLKASGKEIFVARDKNIIKGYIIFEYVKNVLQVIEVIYLDSNALLTLLNQAMGDNKHIIVNVSMSENLNLIINNIKYEVVDHMMIRINDKELFKEIFNLNEASISELLNRVNKPLFIGK